MAMLSDYLRAHMNSKKFLPFVKGVEVVLPSGEMLNLKIKRLLPAREKQLFQFYRHTWFAEVSAGSICEIGCGDSEKGL